VNIERFVIRAVFPLYPSLSRNGKWAIINDITNDRNHEDEVEFVDKKAANQSTNEASEIRAVIQEHRAVLGLANPTEKISELKKDKERCYRLVLRYFVFSFRELEPKTEKRLSRRKMQSRRDGRLFQWGSASTWFQCATLSHIL